ncbi:MAG: hypothetical protein J5821_01575 [Alphaproteobacteria bacterium]|nr:hypothetical protein [Alphaproteobacteria bacterium]
MKNYLLFVFVISLCCVERTVSMGINQTNEFIHSRETHLASDFDNMGEVIRKIRQEKEEYKFDTERKVLEAAENGDEKAFKIIQKLLNGCFGGIAYTVATDIYQKKFVSSSMTEILLKNEDVQDSLNEIIHGHDAMRIIFEATGTEKHWVDVLRDARDGDTTSFTVIMELLEKRYLLDLPCVIARSLGKGLFDEETEKAFSENASVKKEFKRFEKYEEWNDDELDLIFI